MPDNIKLSPTAKLNGIRHNTLTNIINLSSRRVKIKPTKKKIQIKLKQIKTN